MIHASATAFAAGAQDICVQTHGAAGRIGMGAAELQPQFQPVLRRDLMLAVNVCAKEIGLNPSAVMVLEALMSCLPCPRIEGRDSPVSGNILLTVYASNETLCFRAKGLTDRQLRRHLDLLERLGLIQRRDSANGKRFPIMRDGKVIGAFGIDLSPLFEQSSVLIERARQLRDEAEELRGLKSRIMHLRQEALKRALAPAAQAFIDGLRNVLRRAHLCRFEAQQILQQLAEMLCGVAEPATGPTPIATCAEAQAPAVARGQVSKPIEMAKHAPYPGPEANETPVTDGQNVRHLETHSDTKKRKPSSIEVPDWQDLKELASFYPEPKSSMEAAEVAFSFGKMLRIRDELLQRAARTLGLGELLRIQNDMARRCDEILNPEGYLSSVMVRRAV